MPAKSKLRRRGLQKVAGSEPHILKAASLDSQPWLVHGFSTRVCGNSKTFSLNYGSAAGETNRQRFLEAVAGSLARKFKLVALQQVHSDVIHHIEKSRKVRAAGDGMISNVPGLLLAIQTADCLPVLLADPVHHAVGVFHAGWRGTLARIVEKGVGLMRTKFGTDPRQIVVAIGPGIHSCCYRVGKELQEQFDSQFPYAAALFHEVADSGEIEKKYPLLFLNKRAPGHGEPGTELHLDLFEANRRQLLEAGVPAESIEASPLCTASNTDLLFSYRAEGSTTGRMMAVIGIKP